MPPSANSHTRLLFLSPTFLILALSFAAGVCWASAYSIDNKFLLYISTMLTGLILLLNKNTPRLYRTFTLFLLALLFFLLGLQQSGPYSETPAAPHHIYNLIDNKQVVSIDGVLTNHPSILFGDSGPETRIIMQAMTLHKATSHQIRTNASTNTHGLIQLTLNGLLPDELKPGDRFLARTKLSRVDTFSTPGSFNYKKHLANQSIFVKGWVQSPENILKLHTMKSSALTSRINALRFLPERIRHSIATFLDNSLKQPARGLYKAILIGDRTDIPSSVSENFTASGCIHILAISGVHMGLLALIISAVLTWLLKRSQWILLHLPIRKIAAGLALFPLLIYALIAGFNIPVLRALLMTAVFLLAILFDRPGNLLNHIILAAFLIIIWKPAALLTASFQLSFSAVIAIALIYPKLYNFIMREPSSMLSRNPAQGSNSNLMPDKKKRITSSILKWILAGVAVTTAATIGTLPLLIFHFNRFSTVAIISNLLVEPLICFWALIIGLFATLCIPVAPLLAKILFDIGGTGLTIAEKICAFFSSLPFASLWLPTPSLLQITLIYVFLISIAVALHLQKKQRNLFLVIAIVCLFSLEALLSATSMRNQLSGTTAVSILDVGHGSSTLLQLPHNKNILIDGGGAGNDRFNIGERVIAPFLWKKQLRTLDAVIITHPHADHYNGLPFILARFRPKILWINGLKEYDEEYRQLLNIATQYNIETRIAETGDIVFRQGDTLLQCIHSGFPVHLRKNIKVNPIQYKNSNPNDLSIVLRLDTSGKSFLFPADINGALADILVARGSDVEADVLLAPHHGSRSSMSQSFIEAVNPEFVAISAGRNNPFNFPDKSFYDLQNKGIEILTTGMDGTLTFTVEENGIKVSRYQVN